MISRPQSPADTLRSPERREAIDQFESHVRRWCEDWRRKGVAYSDLAARLDIVARSISE